MKHIQVQGADDEEYGRWLIDGEVILLPDGRIQRTDTGSMAYFVRDHIWHEVERRMVTIREPELYFDLWVKLGPDHWQRVIDVDNPATVADVLPSRDEPLIIESIAGLVLRVRVKS